MAPHKSSQKSIGERRSRSRSRSSHRRREGRRQRSRSRSSHRRREERRSRSRSSHRSRNYCRHRRDKKDRFRYETRGTSHGKEDGSPQRAHSTPSPSFNSSTSRESDFAKLAEVLSGIVTTGSKRSNYINERILPEFDPEIKNFSARDWVQKVDMCGEMYDWDNKTK
ncbi:serine/arginine-rich splicing factor 4-like [Belonocnema kinseyi]|uniref:serine/arginine-rich splicing factor 4-like n=1 Tax=Belonocnema kinseyi TaxID=2817044 RepID=UPI00143DF66A|nr:serine/arginine-rich splicing factor 4-like [Belonocnema kinseyi]